MEAAEDSAVLENQTTRHMKPKDLLFGKIAVNLGLVTAEQIGECIRLQQGELAGFQIGKILVQKGYVTDLQLEQVLATQRDYLRKKESTSRQKVEDSIFGKLVVNNGFGTVGEVNTALREQALRETAGMIVPLGSILIENGVLTMKQVEQILKKQWKQILVCNTCRKQFNVFGYEAGRSFPCRKCDTPLTVPRSLDSVHVEGES